MANNYTGVTTSGSDVTAFGTVQAAYDRLVRLPLRARLVYDKLATVRPTRQTAPGSTVIIHIGTDEADATTPLTEHVDPDTVANTVTDITITLAEYGNVVGSTRKLRGLSYAKVDPTLAERVARNAMSTIDKLAQNALDAGSNAQQAADTADASLDGAQATHRLTALEVRQARNTLVSADAQPWADPYFIGVIHPDQHYDLRGETGAGAWRTPREYVDPSDIFSGEAGMFEGFRFVETSRAKVEADAGSGTCDVYTANMVGAECLAKAYAIGEEPSGELPEVVISPVVDKLMRFHYVGWKWLGGYKEFRSQSNVLLHTASSLSL